ncbi:MAG TPA: N-acetylglucosamine-6-phosphate deacetylase [Acidobacteriaceae bacterium]|jgi:N-acetylglucosamine-6-phosphate deacetylase
MAQEIITARTLLTDIGSVEFPVITVNEDGTILDISSNPVALAGDHDTLTAAFFDIHTHGAVGFDVMSASPEGLSTMQRFLASRGVAQYLPTTVTAPVSDTLRSLAALANAIEQPVRDGEAQPLGIHLEGPFLSHAKRGVHPAAELQPPSIELFELFQEAARGHIKLITIAPEPGAVPESSGSLLPDVYRRSSALELIRYAASNGVRVSLGHTNATAAESLAAIDAGAVSATHTYNAMRPLDHREPGILGTMLDDHRLFAELICDGIHAAPPLVRLWLTMKGRDRGILITDAMSATGMPDGDYSLGGLTARVANGRALLADDLARGKETLAGSILTMDVAVSNLRRFTKASLATATRLASHNPAAMLKMPERTRLAPGSVANLNRFDKRGKLVATYLQGQLVAAFEV